MRRLFRNRLVIGTVGLAAALLAVALWPRTVEVDVATVARGPMQVTVDDEGETRVRERFAVTAPVAGRLERVELEPGDPVVRGQTVLARIVPATSALLDPRTRAELSGAAEGARAALGQARADRDQAAASLERARATERRQQQLAEAGLVATDALEASRTARRVAEEAFRAAGFTVARAEYEVQVARARLAAPTSGGGAAIRLVAPIDGIVLKRHRESESVVAAGEPLLDLGDPGDLEVVADLLSSEAVRVSPGDPVWLEQWGGGGALAGRVRRVEPSGFTKVSALGVEEQRVNVIVEIDDAAAARRLGDGYRVEVRIVVWQEDSVVTVPIGSLFRRGDAWAVFVVQDGRARERAARIGERNGTVAQVLEGLGEHDIVVLYPPDTLQDGMRVAPRAAAAAD